MTLTSWPSSVTDVYVQEVLSIFKQWVTIKKITMTFGPYSITNWYGFWAIYYSMMIGIGWMTRSPRSLRWSCPPLEPRTGTLELSGWWLRMNWISGRILSSISSQILSSISGRLLGHYYFYISGRIYIPFLLLIQYHGNTNTNIFFSNYRYKKFSISLWKFQELPFRIRVFGPVLKKTIRNLALGKT